MLLIADIGGYTQYMQSHRTILGHAEATTRRLLQKVVDAAPGFELVEIEGDAAFLSCAVDGLDGDAVVASVTRAARAMHHAFHTERRAVQLNMCPCGSCTQTSGLRLKFVAHVGEVATQTIRRRRKLVGMDVIYVHRLLKSPVAAPEYVLLSEDLHSAGTAADLPVHDISQELEGIGSVHAYWVDVSDLGGPLPAAPDPSLLRRLGGTFGILGRGIREQLGPRRAVVAPVAG